jgi:UDP-N-acetylglucosamine 2-epimerase (non-hydrolysing)
MHWELTPVTAMVAIARRRLLADDDLPARLSATPSPYGDGRASHRIAALVRSLVRE